MYKSSDEAEFTILGHQSIFYCLRLTMVRRSIGMDLVGLTYLVR